MDEQLFQFIWQYSKFNIVDLSTTCGQQIQIFSPGIINHGDGPDFFMAKVKIGETNWVGNVEIHLKASDWYKHSHHNDKKYENIILHVVYINDLQSTFPYPVLELKGKIPPILFKRYRAIMESKSTILCSDYIAEIPEIIKTNWKERLLIERLNRKKDSIKKLLEETNGDWEVSFFRYLGRYLGGNRNKDIFDLLFKSIDTKILAKYANNPFQLEALLLGQGGFLNEELAEDYPKRLLEEYLFLKHKYLLTPIPNFLWDFKSIRPFSFPNVRLAQLAQIVSQHFPFFDKILRSDDPSILFLDIQASFFWTNHCSLSKESVEMPKKIGKSFTNILLINVVAPFLIVYAHHCGDEKYQEKALLLLQNIKPENNQITSLFPLNSLSNQHAGDSQATIQLVENYCKQKKCLSCAFGNKILREEKIRFVVEEEEISWKN